MSKVKSLIYLCLAFLFAGCASPSSNTEQAFQQAKTFVFPVNVTGNNKLALIVHIPDNFHPLKNSYHAGEIIEFIPHTERMSNWRELITIKSEIGKRFSAKQRAQNFSDQILTYYDNAGIWDKTVIDKGLYQEASFLVSYTTKKHRKAFGAIYYVSGPYDLAYVQYEVTIQGTMTDEQALKKVKSFIRNPQFMSVQQSNLALK